MKNNSLNYPLQGTAADMTKLAVIYFFDIYESDPDVNIVNIVHDEIVAESTIEKSTEAATNLVSCMEKAGKLFSEIAMTADFEIGQAWHH